MVNMLISKGAGLTFRWPGFTFFFIKSASIPNLIVDYWLVLNEHQNLACFFGDFPSGRASEMELQYRPYPVPLPIFCSMYCWIIMFYSLDIIALQYYLYWWSLVLRYCYLVICIFIVFCNIYVTPFVFATLLCLPLFLDSCYSLHIIIVMSKYRL